MRRALILVVIVAGLLLVTQARAEAFSLRLTSGATIVTCADGGACDLNSATGAITFIGTVGTWSLNVTTALTTPILGSFSTPEMDLNSVNVGTGTLSILASETGYNTGGSTAAFDLTVGGTATGGSTASFSYWLDDPNALFGTSTLLGSAGPFSGAFAFTGSGSAAVSGDFALTLGALLTGVTGSSASFDQNIRFKAPEPAALLYGLGLGLTAFISRRRRLIPAAS